MFGPGKENKLKTCSRHFPLVLWNRWWLTKKDLGRFHIEFLLTKKTFCVIQQWGCGCLCNCKGFFFPHSPLWSMRVVSIRRGVSSDQTNKVVLENPAEVTYHQIRVRVCVCLCVSLAAECFRGLKLGFSKNIQDEKLRWKRFHWAVWKSKNHLKMILQPSYIISYNSLLFFCPTLKEFPFLTHFRKLQQATGKANILVKFLTKSRFGRYPKITSSGNQGTGLC